MNFLLPPGIPSGARADARRKDIHAFRSTRPAVLRRAGPRGDDGPEWQLRGTNHTDRIYVIDDGYVVGDLRGGNDVFVGGPGDVIVEGGPGRDRADGYLGTDICTGFEAVVSCEET